MQTIMQRHCYCYTKYLKYEHTTVLTETISLCSLIIILLRDTSWHRVTELNVRGAVSISVRGEAKGRSCPLIASSFLSTPRLDEMMQKKSAIQAHNVQ